MTQVTLDERGALKSLLVEGSLAPVQEGGRAPTLAAWGPWSSLSISVLRAQPPWTAGGRRAFIPGRAPVLRAPYSAFEFGPPA